MYDTHLPAAYINMEDETVSEEDIAEYMRKFYVGVKLIEMYREKGYNVLVHCAAGINRSATTIAFFLMKHHFSYFQVLSAIRSANQKRGVSYLTNRSFRVMLRVNACKCM
jgi:protein-tyrosine phosphatase